MVFQYWGRRGTQQTPSLHIRNIGRPKLLGGSEWFDPTLATDHAGTRHQLQMMQQGLNCLRRWAHADNVTGITQTGRQTDGTDRQTDRQTDTKDAKRERERDILSQTHGQRQRETHWHNNAYIHTNMYIYIYTRTQTHTHTHTCVRANIGRQELLYWSMYKYTKQMDGWKDGAHTKHVSCT